MNVGANSDLIKILNSRCQSCNILVKTADSRRVQLIETPGKSGQIEQDVEMFDSSCVYIHVNIIRIDPYPNKSILY